MAVLTVQLWETHANLFLLGNAAVTQDWVTERTHCHLIDTVIRIIGIGILSHHDFEDYVGISKSPEHRSITSVHPQRGPRMNSWTSESTYPPWKHILDRLTGSSRSPRV